MPASVTAESSFPPKVTRIDPRRTRTREAIIRAGQELFSHHHPDGVSMDELVRAAAISKQSFYNHFTDKDDLAHEILRIARAEVHQLVVKANGDEADPARRLAVGLAANARQVFDNPPRARLLARISFEIASKKFDDDTPLITDLQAGLMQGRLAMFTLDTGIAFILGMSQALITRVLLDGQMPIAIATTQQFIILTLRAFGLSPIEAEMIAAQATDRILLHGD